MKIDIEDEKNLLTAKIKDKIRLSKIKKQIIHTDFLNQQELKISEKYLKQNKIDNYIFFGGYEEAERKSIITYPDEKLDFNMVESNFNTIFSIIRISLCSEMKGKFEHRDYLSAIMKLGIERGKIGDIIVHESFADIIVFKENVEYLISNLKLLTRFRKSQINELTLDELIIKEKKFEIFSIIVTSMRIDSFVSELAKTSRSKAIEIIEFGRVLVNYEEVLKPSKQISIGDVITIRGKGKFIVGNIERKTRNDRFVISIKKYA